MYINKQKTILFIMPRLPFPAISGRKTSLYHYCRILSEELGYQLVVAAFLESGDNLDLKPSFINRLEILDEPSGKERFINLLKDSFLLRKKPMQVSLYWSERASKAINKIYEEVRPDYVIGDMIRSTEYIKNFDTVRIADLDDRISLRYQRQLDSDMEGINPYGSYLGRIPKILQNILMQKFIKKIIVKNEINLLKKYELEIGKVCDKTVFVAQKEADQFNNELGEKKAIAIPIGVDTDYFEYRGPGSNNIVGFLGAMNVAHNDNAARTFATKIMADIVKRIPDAKFYVIGGGVSDDLKKLGNANVVFTGRVDDVREYLAKCKVFVCPMNFGSGIKTKNLEAMSMGIPVVTTSIGAENIDAKDGQEWIIANTALEFSDAVCSLLESKEKLADLSGQSRKYIVNNWTWESAKNAFISLLCQ